VAIWVLMDLVRDRTESGAAELCILVYISEGVLRVIGDWYMTGMGIGCCVSRRSFGTRRLMVKEITTCYNFFAFNLFHPACWRCDVRPRVHGVLIYRPGDIANGKDIKRP
jgi:hypothetical protein